jgi:hypothetical protein
MVLPGARPKEKWGTMSYEPWYNPYLLEPDNARQAGFFRSMFDDWKVPCSVLITVVEGIQESHERIIGPRIYWLMPRPGHTDRLAKSKCGLEREPPNWSS